MKKRIFLAALASCAVVASMFPMTANATGTNYSGLTTAATTDEKPISKNTTTFDKYLVMDVEANVPNAAFNFAIEKYDNTQADKAVLKSADDTHLAVLNGVGDAVFTVDSTKSGSETAGEVKFVQADTANTKTEGATGEDAPDVAVVWKDDESENEKYAKKSLTLDFSGVQFDEPGVYRYLITETGENQGIENDTGVASVLDNGNETKKGYRTLDVYVEDYDGYYNSLKEEDKDNYPAPTADKKLLITGYVMYNGKNSDAPSKDGGTVEKSTSYTNTYTSYDLTFSKAVTGNQGSKDKYFKFDIKISKAVPGTVYTVDLSGADNTVPSNAATNPEYVGKENPTSVTIDDEGKAEAICYLQNGQAIKLLGLAAGTAYEITETTEDYVASVVVAGDTIKEEETDPEKKAVGLSENKVSDTEITADTTIAFTNNREGVIPTGVILSVAAPVVIGLAVLGGIIFLVIRNKKRDAEEEE